MENSVYAQCAYDSLKMLVQQEVENANIRHLIVGLTFVKEKSNLKVLLAGKEYKPLDRIEAFETLTSFNEKYNENALIVYTEISDTNAKVGIQFRAAGKNYVASATIDLEIECVTFSDLTHVDSVQGYTPVDLRGYSMEIETNGVGRTLH